MAFFVDSNFFNSNGDFTISGEGLQNLSCTHGPLAERVFKRAIPTVTLHGHPFIHVWSSPRTPRDTHTCCRAVNTFSFNNLGLARPGFEPLTFSCEANALTDCNTAIKTEDKGKETEIRRLVNKHITFDLIYGNSSLNKNT